MAKIKRTYYFRLGAKASSFFDPISRMKVLKDLDGKANKKTAKIISALSAGHLVEISEEEYTRANKAGEEKASKVETAKAPEYTKQSLNKMKADELKLIASKMATSATELNEIMDMNKADLVDFILNPGQSSDNAGEEDEDEEDEDTSEDDDADEDDEEDADEDEN